MTPDRNAELLGEVPLFHGLSPEQLSTIASIGEKIFFEADTEVVKAHSKSKSAYLILSGSVETRPPKKSKLEAESFDVGTLIGEMAMLTETIATMTIVATNRVRALAIHRDALYKLMEENAEIAFHLSDRLTERLINLANDLRELDKRLSTVEISAEASIATLA